ncbi:F-box protein 24 [Phyllostomus discolor]|uniref:F-box protein 24 n=1 Tax=Phyllostomus discolor TaxID=89673 RepID=A0A834B878_9CHIR|nr:F-box protein 24 [Phyllostomus discolor]
MATAASCPPRTTSSSLTMQGLSSSSKMPWSPPPLARSSGSVPAAMLCCVEEPRILPQTQDVIQFTANTSTYWLLGSSWKWSARLAARPVTVLRSTCSPAGSGSSR